MKSTEREIGNALTGESVLVTQLCWSKDLLTGNPYIDFLHRKLIQKLQKLVQSVELYQTLNSQANRCRVNLALSEFTGSLISHYELENFLLLKEPLTKELRQNHIKEHKKEMQFFKDLCCDFANNNIIISTNFLALMINKFRSHIKESDGKSFSRPQDY